MRIPQYFSDWFRIDGIRDDLSPHDLERLHYALEKIGWRCYRRGRRESRQQPNITSKNSRSQRQATEFHYDRLNLPTGGWKTYRKKTITYAMRIPGPFVVRTREGELRCPDGYLAVDSEGWPYPISRDEFEKIYEEV